MQFPQTPSPSLPLYRVNIYMVMDKTAQHQHNMLPERVLLHHSDKAPLPPVSVHIDVHEDHHQNQTLIKDSWLPITQSRHGNSFFAAFHILNSNLGFQALMLPSAFAALGWAWGSVCFSLAFVWQLYTIFLLLLLHESVPGLRYSRFLSLATAAFGQRMGKVAAFFPVMYLSGGSCVMFIITGSWTLQLFFNTFCPKDTCHAHPLSGALWFLVFTSIAILVAQLTPSLNSVAGVSIVGAITAITYCTLFWVLSLSKGRPASVSSAPSLSLPGHHHPSLSNVSKSINAIGIIVLSFRGHNVMLEIQGTLPSSTEKPCKELMRKGVIVAYAVIAMCVFPLAIAGFWAYGNQIPEGGMVSAFSKVHGHQVTKFTMGLLLYLPITIHCLSSFQVYAMPVFDSLEMGYIKAKKKRCSRLVRGCMRVMFGALTLFIAVTFPFLPKLAALLGGMTLVPVTYAYPCFMWVAIKKPPKGASQWCFNVALGCLGLLLSLLLAASSIWTLARYGFHANFFNP
ncbi:lysine histidine transporter-like 8 [Prosopis cineraria]|uniref:lysine histidine transporter-like 8 n=1 Tax=Prosopis cineraria TaxID=364024 RepID=UPI00240EC6BE|nr:lysine histidine transporter-like 8 [Prosopis cineraria]